MIENFLISAHTYKLHAKLFHSSSSYSTTALSAWPWLPLVSEHFNFPG